MELNSIQLTCKINQNYYYPWEIKRWPWRPSTMAPMLFLSEYQVILATDSIDHDIASLAEIINLCHQYQVKVNLAFNILIFKKELPKVVELSRGVFPEAPMHLLSKTLASYKLLGLWPLSSAFMLQLK